MAQKETCVPLRGEEEKSPPPPPSGLWSGAGQNPRPANIGGGLLPF